MSYDNMVRALPCHVPGTRVTICHSHLFPWKEIINCNLTSVQRNPRLVRLSRGQKGKQIPVDPKMCDQCKCLNKMFSQPHPPPTHTHTIQLRENIYEYELLLREVLDLFQPTKEAVLSWKWDLLIFLIPSCFAENIKLFLTIVDNELASLTLDHSHFFLNL